MAEPLASKTDEPADDPDDKEPLPSWDTLHPWFASLPVVMGFEGSQRAPSWYLPECPAATRSRWSAATHIPILRASSLGTYLGVYFYKKGSHADPVYELLRLAGEVRPTVVRHVPVSSLPSPFASGGLAMEKGALAEDWIGAIIRGQLPGIRFRPGPVLYDTVYPFRVSLDGLAYGPTMTVLEMKMKECMVDGGEFPAEPPLGYQFQVLLNMYITRAARGLLTMAYGHSREWYSRGAGIVPRKGAEWEAAVAATGRGSAHAIVHYVLEWDAPRMEELVRTLMDIWKLVENVAAGRVPATEEAVRDLWFALMNRNPHRGVLLGLRPGRAHPITCNVLPPEWTTPACASGQPLVPPLCHVVRDVVDPVVAALLRHQPGAGADISTDTEAADCDVQMHRRTPPTDASTAQWDPHLGVVVPPMFRPRAWEVYECTRGQHGDCAACADYLQETSSVLPDSL